MHAHLVCIFFFWERPQWEAWVLWHMAGISLCNYLSALLICFEWSWPCSERACGFPHLWLFAVVSALSESPSVQEETEQFPHCFFSSFTLSLVPWHSLGFHFFGSFFKCTLKTSGFVPVVYFALGVKGRLVSTFRAPPLSLLAISFTWRFQTSLLSSADFNHPADTHSGLGATRNFPVETWVPLGNLPVWITVRKARPEGARLQSKGRAGCAGFDSLPCVIICVFAEGMENGPW